MFLFEKNRLLGKFRPEMLYGAAVLKIFCKNQRKKPVMETLFFRLEIFQ